MKTALFSHEAERAALGAVLVNNATMDEILPVLEGPDSFHNEAHRVIFQAMAALHAERRPVDEVTLPGWLEARGKVDAAGGLAYVFGLISATPTSARAFEYAAEVRDKAILRRTMSLCAELEGLAEKGEPAQAVLERAEAGLFALGQGRADSGAVELRAALPRALAELEALGDKSGPRAGISTGLREIDSILGGWRPGEMISLAGRTGTGKTAFALNAAYAAARAGVPVLFVALEMDAVSLARRLIQISGGVMPRRLEVGFQADTERRKTKDAGSLLEGLPIWIADSPRQTLWSIRSEARRFKARHETCLVILDYIQLTAPTREQRRLGRFEFVGEVSTGIKQLAREIHAPILSLAQLNRSAESAKDGYQLLNHLRESGSLEQDSDAVITLANLEGNGDRAEVAVTIAKHRHGRTGDVAVLFDKSTQRFLPLTHEPAPDRPTRPKEPPRADYGDVFEDEWTGAEEESLF